MHLLVYFLCSWDCVLKSFIPISYSLFKTFFQLLLNSDWQPKWVEIFKRCIEINWALSCVEIKITQMGSYAEWHTSPVLNFTLTVPKFKHNKLNLVVCLMSNCVDLKMVKFRSSKPLCFGNHPSLQGFWMQCGLI